MVNGILEVKEPMRVYRQGISKSDGKKFLFWDRSTILAPGSMIEVSEPVRLCQKLALPFMLDEKAKVFIIFDELSRENQKDVRELFPHHLRALWIN